MFYKKKKGILQGISNYVEKLSFYLNMDRTSVVQLLEKDLERIYSGRVDEKKVQLESLEEEVQKLKVQEEAFILQKKLLDATVSLTVTQIETIVAEIGDQSKVLKQHKIKLDELNRQLLAIKDEVHLEVKKAKVAEYDIMMANHYKSESSDFSLKKLKLFLTVITVIAVVIVIVILIYKK